jgi:hypothetical protein
MKMKIHVNRKVVPGVFQFEHAGATISVTTITRFPEVVIFDGRKSHGPFHGGIPEAIRFAESMAMHKTMQEIAA